jgi:hypothetical protein
MEVVKDAPYVDEWQITFVGGLDLSVVIIFLIGITVVTAITWRSLDPFHTIGVRLGITCLRGLALLTGMGLLLQPALHMKRLNATPSELAFVVDASNSMALGASGGRLAGLGKKLDKAVVELGKTKQKLEPAWYRFADDLVVGDGPQQATEPLKKSKKTDIKGALSKLVKMKGRAPLDGVVLISDGADTELGMGKGGIVDTGWAKNLGVPINTVFIGNRENRKDIVIENAVVEPFAFSRSETPIVENIRNVGYSDREIEALLWQDGSVAQRRTVELVGGKGQFTFTVLPSTVGQHVFTVTVPIPPDDEVPENNRAHVSFDVIRDKFRILHIVGRPSWDQRFLRETLKGWPRVDVVSFYILRTAYQSSTLGSAGMALIPFPTDEIFKGHLGEFDIVIFQDFEPASVGVDRYDKEIVDFVKNGGAVVLIGGINGLSGGKMTSGTFGDIFPVKLLPAGTHPKRLYDETPFRPRLTEEGINHPMMGFAKWPKKNTEYWNSLSRLDGIGRVASLTDGSVRLAEHPFVQADDGPTPVISVREVEKGRSLAITTDSLWKWRFFSPMMGGPADAYIRFWRQAVLWLTRSPDLDRLRVDVNPSPVTVGEATQFEIELLDETYRPVSGAGVSCVISWISEDGVETKDEFKVVLDDRGRYVREWIPKEEGSYRLTVTSADGVETTRRFLVNTEKKELAHLESNEQLMEDIALATGGSFQKGTMKVGEWMTSGGAERQVLSFADTPLWDHPLAIFLFVALLTGEWLLRRRLGLG